MVNLQNTWVLWNHSINDNNWSMNSYKKLYTINNLYDYKLLEEVVTNNNLQNTMLFLMRDEIFPIWEHPDNRMGSCASFKVASKDILTTWNNLIKNCIIENLENDIKNYNNINGILISPKKEFNIIKIWFRDNIETLKNINTFEPYICEENCRLKKHITD